MVLRSTRPGKLWSYGVDGLAWRADEHETVRWCRLLAAHGVPADPGDLYLDRPRSRGGGPVLLHPGAAHAARRWPVSHYAEVAAALAGDSLRVLVSAGPGELALAQAVVRLARLDAACVLADLEMPALLELVGQSRLVVCADTGIANVATALRTPSVLLFGPTSPAHWGPPPGRLHHVLWRPSRRDASPPAGQPHPALLRIGPGDVLDATSALTR